MLQAIGDYMADDVTHGPILELLEQHLHIPQLVQVARFLEARGSRPFQAGSASRFPRIARVHRLGVSVIL
jgi:hypothetical protein